MKNTKKILLLSIMFIILITNSGCKQKVKNNLKKKNKIVLSSLAFNEDEINAPSAIKALEDKGYEVEIVPLENATVMNEATLDGSIDASVNAHQPWLDHYNEQNNTDLIMLKPYLHYNDFSIMSSKYDSVDQLPDAATIAISDDGSNQARALFFLEELGLIKLDPNVTVPTPFDIVENYKNLKIIPVEHHQVVATMDDVDACMTSTYLLLSSNVSLDTVMATSEDYINYGVGFVIDSKEKDEQWVKDLMEAYITDEVRDRIQDYFKGGFRPGF